MSPTRADLPRQELSTAPLRADGRPAGSKCQPTCRGPVGNQAHCSVCHATLRSVGDFDRHRLDGWCLDLGALDLIEVDRLWGTTEAHEAAKASAVRLALVRQPALPCTDAEPRTGPVWGTAEGAP